MIDILTYIKASPNYETGWRDFNIAAGNNLYLYFTGNSILAVIYLEITD